MFLCYDAAHNFGGYMQEYLFLRRLICVKNVAAPEEQLPCVSVNGGNIL